MQMQRSTLFILFDVATEYDHKRELMIKVLFDFDTHDVNSMHVSYSQY
jgi:hypothetical protein